MEKANVYILDSTALMRDPRAIIKYAAGEAAVAAETVAALGELERRDHYFSNEKTRRSARAAVRALRESEQAGKRAAEWPSTLIRGIGEEEGVLKKAKQIKESGAHPVVVTCDHALKLKAIGQGYGAEEPMEEDWLENGLPDWESGESPEAEIVECELKSGERIRIASASVETGDNVAGDGAFSGRGIVLPFLGEEGLPLPAKKQLFLRFRTAAGEAFQTEIYQDPKGVWRANKTHHAEGREGWVCRLCGSLEKEKKGEKKACGAMTSNASRIFQALASHPGVKPFSFPKIFCPERAEKMKRRIRG